MASSNSKKDVVAGCISRLVRVERIPMRATETRRNPSAQPTPETRRRLGGTQAHNPRRRLCKDSAEPKHTSQAIDSAETLTHTGSLRWSSFSHDVKEHATPLAGACVETGVEVHNTGDVADSAASGGCSVSTCSACRLLSRRNPSAKNRPRTPGYENPLHIETR